MNKLSNEQQWLENFKSMWEACRNPNSSAELVESSSIDLLIKMAETPKESNQVCHEDLLKLADIFDRIKSNQNQ